ncbi:MAG: bifunctional metallophosphatase/5'-nucleotidase [Rubrobacteraceae bacterium]
MNRASRTAMVGALILSIILIPGLLSLTRAEPENAAPKSTDLSSTGAPTGMAKVRLLGVNDFHGHLEEAASLAAYLDRYERRNPEGTIRIHAGDMVGGSPLVSGHFHDEPAIHAMNEMSFDVGTLGNHEFDEGGEKMLRLVNGGQKSGARNTSGPDFPGADFPYIAANALRESTGEPVLPPYRIVERDGARVGFIGVTTLETPEILAGTVEPFRFLDVSDTVNRYAAELRRKGVETIVVLAHEGGYQTGPMKAAGPIAAEAAQMSGAVDVVVAGHTHAFLKARAGGKLVVEAGEYGTAFSVVDLRVDRATGHVKTSSARIVTNDGDFGADPRIAAMVEKYEERVAPISDRVSGRAAGDVTRSTTPAGESALGDLVTDAYRSSAGTDFAFVVSGGLRADVAAGPVTYGDLYAARPFDKSLVEMELTGAEVHRVLEQQFDGEPRILQVSGLRIAYDPSRPEGRRMTSLTLPGGASLDRKAIYTAAIAGPLAEGGSGFTGFREGQNVRPAGKDLDALVKHIKSMPQPFEAPDPEEQRRMKLAN